MKPILKFRVSYVKAIVPARAITKALDPQSGSDASKVLDRSHGLLPAPVDLAIFVFEDHVHSGAFEMPGV